MACGPCWLPVLCGEVEGANCRWKEGVDCPVYYRPFVYLWQLNGRPYAYYKDNGAKGKLQSSSSPGSELTRVPTQRDLQY